MRLGARPHRSFLALLLSVALAPLVIVHARPLSGSALVAALRQGGCVILMRHASSPNARPTAATAASGNRDLERQLDGKGLAEAKAMGEALKRLGIPIARVASSPTFRARETVAAAGLGTPTILDELGDAGRSMSRSAVAAWSQRLRHAVARRPPSGSNTLIVTQGPNIIDAYGRLATGLEAGGALIFHPDGHGQVHWVATVPIGEWPRLAARLRR